MIPSFKRALTFTLLITWVSGICPIDNPHFYRATNFLPPYYEPRLAKPGLTSFDAYFGGGRTKTARNECGDKTPLLNIFGPFNMQALGLGLPCRDLECPADLALTQLALEPCRCTFAQLQFCGKFSIFEANLFYTQNFDHGIFLQMHLPVRRMKINDITYCDLSPDDCLEPNRCSDTWQTTLNLLPSILDRYCLSICPTSVAGAGDLSVLGGWTYNYEDTTELDYVDFTLRIGVLAPTGKKSNPDEAFSLPTGYNGHIGVPMSFSAAMGTLDWLTLGFHTSALLFNSRTKCLRVQTNEAQQGFIKLISEPVKVDAGTIWEACAYAKADHVVGGASFWGAYTFVNKDKDTVAPCKKMVNAQAICSDKAFDGFKMHTFTLMFEYDLTRMDARYGARFGLFYTLQVGGRNTFDTDMGGGNVGIDFSASF